MEQALVTVRYMVSDVQASIDWYTAHVGFTAETTQLPAFANVRRGGLRIFLSGPASAAGRPMPDGAQPGPGGWNRVQLVVEDIAADVARLRGAGVQFRGDVVKGPAGSLVLLVDPSGNLVELFEPAHH